MSNKADLKRHIAEVNYHNISFILAGVGFAVAYDKLKGYAPSVLLRDPKDGSEVWESEYAISRASRFTCNFNESTFSVLKTANGMCEVSRLVEVWNEERTESVTIMI